MADTSENTASKIIHAAKKGLTADVLRLLRNDEMICATATDKHGRNCLHLAAIYGHFDTTLAILQTSMIDVNSSNSKGLTPLHDACLECHSDIVLLLLSFGAYIMARSKDGWTCAMCACSSGHAQLAQMLFAAGCDINALSRHDLTALHIAAWKGHADVVEMLVSEGCAVGQNSKNGKTALDLARDEGHLDCCTILEAAMGLNSTDLSVRLKATEGQLKVANERLKRGQENFSELLQQEKKKWEMEFAKTKEQHQKEVNGLKEEIKVLNNQLMLKMQKPQPHEKLPSPESPRVRKKGTKRGGRRPTELPSSLTTHLMLPAENRLSKSAENLANWSAEDDEQHGSEKDGLKVVLSKMSITNLVEESLRRPESIAMIRKELKDDKFTPKIQRKFSTESKPPPLNEIKPTKTPGDEHTPTSPSSLATQIHIYQSDKQ